jgi:hypothetical protein
MKNIMGVVEGVTVVVLVYWLALVNPFSHAPYDFPEGPVNPWTASGTRRQSPPRARQGQITARGNSGGMWQLAAA